MAAPGQTIVVEPATPAETDAIRLLPNDPHCRQHVAYWNAAPGKVKLHRVVRLQEPLTHYQRRTGMIKTTLQWGQRKLALVLLEFLTLFASPGDIVVYAGAAPGTNIAFLAGLFQDVEFHLYDPREFNRLVRQHSNIKTYRQYFTDQTARSYAGLSNILFVSDIRTGTDIDSDDVFERRVWEDMLAQQRWYRLMEPKKAHLKFRLPYSVAGQPTDGALEYLSGTVIIQPWAKVTSTEGRLVPDGLTREWSFKWYEDCMFQHNVVTRTSIHPHTVKAPGLDHCFDCASEVSILQQFLLKTTGVAPDAEVEKLSRRISVIISDGRYTLATYTPRRDEE